MTLSGNAMFINCKLSLSDIKFKPTEPKRHAESPEVEALKNGKNGHVNNAYTPASPASTQL